MPPWIPLAALRQFLPYRPCFFEPSPSVRAPNELFNSSACFSNFKRCSSTAICWRVNLDTDVARSRVDALFARTMVQIVPACAKVSACSKSVPFCCVFGLSSGWLLYLTWTHIRCETDGAGTERRNYCAFLCKFRCRRHACKAGLTTFLNWCERDWNKKPTSETTTTKATATATSNNKISESAPLSPDCLIDC